MGVSGLGHETTKGEQLWMDLKMCSETHLLGDARHGRDGEELPFTEHLHLLVV